MSSEDRELERSLVHALDADAPQAPSHERITALRSRSEAARDQRTSSSRSVATARRRGVAPWMAAAAAIVALVVGAGAVWLIGRGDDGAVAGDVEYSGPMDSPDGEPAAVDLSVVATGIGRVVDLDTAVLPILPTGELYEVWFVGPGDAPETPNRISAGTFHPDLQGRSQVRFAAAVDPALFPVIEITAEPGDGNPSPTGPVVLRARLAR